MRALSGKTVLCLPLHIVTYFKDGFGQKVELNFDVVEEIHFSTAEHWCGIFCNFMHHLKCGMQNK